MEPDTIRALFVALRDENVEYVLVGALAMDVLGIGRLTEDIDLFVRPTPDNVDRLRRALRRVWHDPSIDEITAADLAGDYPAVQYIAPDGTPIDILARLGEAFEFADLGATVTDNVDTNLGIHYFVDGTEVQTVQIDTSTAGDHSIKYTATDAAGNEGVATRELHVVPPVSAPTDGTSTSSSTPDTASSTPVN